MIIILALLTIGIVITWASWEYCDENTRKSNSIFAGLGCSVVITAFLIASLSVSYESYLSARSFYSATKEQYHSAIEVYTDHAVIDMGKAAFTDLKYQGYQENVGRFVGALRNKIIRYNTVIVKKRVMGKNLFFNWLIIEPDEDMIIIKMKTE